MRKILMAAAAGLAALAALPAAAAQTVNVGICVSWPGYGMLKLAQEKGLIENYDLNFTIFEDPLGGHAALAAGQIDAYGCTIDYVPLVVERGTDVVNVAFMNPSYGVDHVILAPDTAPADLKGRKVSAPQAYIGQLLMGLYLDREGVPVDDVTWVNLNADEAVGPMLSGDLSAAYMYEPWISKVLQALPGAKSVIDTSDPKVLETGIFNDGLYMNTKFIADNREAALAVLKARWDGLGYWNQNTEEANQMLADFFQWPVEDVQFVVGTNGKSFDGGIYMFDFDESARMCGVLEGEPPFGIENGAMPRVISDINKWWIKLGLMTSEVDASKGIDCSLMGDLVKSGYRQTLKAH